MVCRIGEAIAEANAADPRMRHKKLLTLQILNELMYDFDKKSKQNIQAIYYNVSTASSPVLRWRARTSEALNSEISLRFPCSRIPSRSAFEQRFFMQSQSKFVASAIECTRENIK